MRDRDAKFGAGLLGIDARLSALRYTKGRKQGTARCTAPTASVNTSLTLDRPSNFFAPLQRASELGDDCSKHVGAKALVLA